MKNIILNLSPKGSLIIKYKDGGVVDFSELSLDFIKQLYCDIDRIKDIWDDYLKHTFEQYEQIKPENHGGIPLKPNSDYKNKPAYEYWFDLRLYAVIKDNNLILDKMKPLLKDLGINFLHIDSIREGVTFYMKNRDDVIAFFNFMYKSLTPTIEDLEKGGVVLVDNIIPVE
jgi:hypothetical protein